MQTVSAVLVFIGAAIMLLNILQSIVLVRRFRAVGASRKSKIRVGLICFVGLLGGFLIGYLTVGISYLLYPPDEDRIVVALIFLFGSIFVNISISLQVFLSGMVQNTTLDMIQGLVNTVEARDSNLNGHSKHVASLTVLLYSRMPRSMQRQVDAHGLEYAAILHDIGKLGISEAILNKSGPLSDEEWMEIKKHPLIGKNILSAIEYFQPFADWVLYHHERMDGKGYYGLPKEQIPLASRIIAVADTYSAITMERSYHAARSYAQAAQVLLECKDTQLDAHLVDLFLTIDQFDVDGCMPNMGVILLENEGWTAAPRGVTVPAVRIS